MTTKDDNFRTVATQMLKEGGLALIPDYLEKVQDSGDLEDMRKAVELILKANGMFGNEKTDNLPTIHWNINGGTVVFGAEPPKPNAATELVEVLDATVEEAATPQPTLAPPEAEPEQGFDLAKIDEMLGLDA